MPIALIATIKLFARLRFLRPSAAKIARRAIETIENVEQRCARARYAALVLAAMRRVAKHPEVRGDGR